MADDSGSGKDHGAGPVQGVPIVRPTSAGAGPLRAIQGGLSGAGAGAGASPSPVPIQRYDPAEFIVGGRGKNGELEPITFKIHEGYKAEVAKWVDSRRFPYKDKTDLVRHAIVRHLYYLKSMEGEVEGTLHQELAQIDKSTADWRFQNDFMKQIESIAEEVNRCLALPGGKREVDRRLRGYRRRVEATKPGFYKDVYLKMFNDRFGAYMSGLTLIEYTDEDRGDGE